MVEMKSPKFLIILSLTVFLMMLLYLNYTILRNESEVYAFNRSWYVFKKAPCSHPKELLNEMADLAYDASASLAFLNVSSTACFGTLLGALKMGKVLPWDNNIDLCIVHQISANFDEIKSTFAGQNIQIFPFESWSGHYRIVRDGIEGYINVFTECTILSHLRFGSELRREGMETEGDKTQSWLCPEGIMPYSAQFIYKFTKPIPSSLLAPPFISLSFGDNKAINIPNGDTEILKYIYPESWWLEVKPVDCP